MKRRNRIVSFLPTSSRHCFYLAATGRLTQLRLEAQLFTSKEAHEAQASSKDRYGPGQWGIEAVG